MLGQSHTLLRKETSSTFTKKCSLLCCWGPKCPKDTLQGRCKTSWLSELWQLRK